MSLPAGLDLEGLPPSHAFHDESPVDGTSTLDEDISGDSSSRATTSSPASRSNHTSATPQPSADHDADGDKVRDGEHRHSNTSSLRSARAPTAVAESATLPRGEKIGDTMPVDQDTEMNVPSSAYDFPTLRTKPPCICPFLRPGSKFQGMQQSEKQKYEVQVEIKHVDPRESLLCGYLRIQGLTEDHPTLTTYFEGEIIGSKYNFFTANEAWGATHKDDLSHWAKFGAFRPFQKQARRGIVHIPDVFQREHIFMRWKEHFLVPDHRVRTITGASFEGFYYICFNQLRGEVSGIYFHSKSEKFQQLELKHVKDRGCFSAVEFR